MNVDSYVGEIRMFGGRYAPPNWALCNGQILAVMDYQELFALIGSTYGGDGRTTFALPDLRGRVPIDQGHGTGLSSRVLGDRTGTETVALTVNQIPSHLHPMQASSDPVTGNDPVMKVLATGTDGVDNFYSEELGLRKASFDSVAVESAGQNIPHNNMMPSLAVCFIIALKGGFPPRS